MFKKITNWMGTKAVGIIITFALFFISLVVYVYIDYFGFSSWSNIGDWAATGDFFGGVLNPILAFMSLILIAYTLLQNKKALEQNQTALSANIEELELSRRELASSAEMQRTQAEHAEMQRFEDTFFSLLQVLNDINLDGVDLNYIIRQAYKSIHLAPIDALGLDMNYENINYLAAVDQLGGLIYPHSKLNQYFRTLYQILKLIAVRCPEVNQDGEWFDNIKGIECKGKGKEYSNILRSMLSSEIIILLAVNCISPHDDLRGEVNKFKVLVEHYAFFEHIDLKKIALKPEKLILVLLSYYEHKAFGDNEKVEKLILKTKNI